MNINIASLPSKDHSTMINVNRKYFSINTFKNNGTFTPGPPANSVTVSEKCLTTLGRLGKQMITAPMGTVKTMLFSKIDFSSKSKEPLLTISFSKELTKRSLYSVIFTYAKSNESFTYDFAYNPTIEITSDDISVEMWSTDFFVEFLSVLSAPNLTIFKNISIDPTSAVTITENGNKAKKTNVESYEPPSTNIEDDIAF